MVSKGFEPYFNVRSVACYPLHQKTLLARVERFELPSTVLETGMLPLHHTHVFFVIPNGLEPLTPSLKVRCSNQLSYEVILTFFCTIKLFTLLSIFYFIVEIVGYDPTPLDFQSSASTKLASSPYVGMIRFELITFRVSGGCSHH